MGEMASNHLDFVTACPTCGSIQVPTGHPYVGHAPSPRVSELLRCNDIPSETELSDFQDMVNRGPERIADIDVKIAQAKVLVEELQRQRIWLTMEMEGAKIVSSPVRRLPPDVLRSICLAAIPSPSEIMSPSFGFFDSLDTRESPWTISHVCRAWRSFVLGSSELWSSTSLVIDRGSPMRMARDEISSSKSDFHRTFLFGTRLQRSQSHPLTVSLLSTRNAPQHPFLAQISVHASALKNLRIHVPIESLRAFYGCRGRLHSLENLMLQSTDSSGPVAPHASTIDVFEYAPELRVCTAHHIPDTVTIPWHQLNHCVLQINFEQDLPFLERLHNVKSANIQTNIFGFARVLPGRTPIRLPRLKSLTLISQNNGGTMPNIRVILSSLSLPNLVSLCLIYHTVPVLPHISKPNMISKLEIRLQLLRPDGHVYEKYTFPGLLSLLHTVPNLHHLVLYSDRALSSDDISRLRLTPLQSHIPVPRLRVLDLSGCKLDCDHSSLVEIVETRRQGNNPECDQLEILHLASPLELDGRAADIWQTLLDEGLKVVYGAQNMVS
ncbi:hypothetical protein EDD18DRAFT_76864 [Armillaria luteobubalina]|uniref:F-box domain-containing protein n=1 Tax=Armillaria luteobubalina TaxID=153913 RepID=A0AA39P5W6_9AGAR|nr:hypothetical protein EDD18DRAFT_76864 [Armillaria luteobubalina]